MIYKPDPQVVFTELDDSEAVLLHLRSQRYYSLNESGSRIWRLMAEGKTTQEIAAKLLAEYDVSPEAVADEISLLLEELVEEGLARRISSPAKTDH